MPIITNIWIARANPDSAGNSVGANEGRKASIARTHDLIPPDLSFLGDWLWPGRLADRGSIESSGEDIPHSDQETYDEDLRSLHERPTLSGFLDRIVCEPEVETPTPG
jgi:hypothetical protein